MPTEIVFYHSIDIKNKFWPKVSVFYVPNEYYATISGGTEEYPIYYKGEARGTILGSLCELLNDEYEGKMSLLPKEINWSHIIMAAIRSFEKKDIDSG